MKKNLDSLRRTKALYHFLNKNGLECEILVNDYRAQLLGRDWGLPLATTVETIKDIDAVAKRGDRVIIDSDEELEGKVLNYPHYFEKLIYINSRCKDAEYKDAHIINVFDKFNPDLNKKILRKDVKKMDKTLLIYGDSDYSKTILKNSDLFKEKNWDLYWGIYFFVKYEKELKEIFNHIVEAEEYYEAINSYKNVVSFSLWSAVEAAICGANVKYFSFNEPKECYIDLLNSLGIEIVIINNKKTYKTEENIINSIKKFDYKQEILSILTNKV